MIEVIRKTIAHIEHHKVPIIEIIMATVDTFFLHGRRDNQIQVTTILISNYSFDNNYLITSETPVILLVSLVILDSTSDYPKLLLVIK